MPLRQDLKRLLWGAGIRPSRRMGQSFLVEEEILHHLARSLKEQGGEADVVIEVGCGPGNFTKVLLEEGFRVVAIELDRRLGRICRRELGARDGLLVLLADALRPPLGRFSMKLKATLASNVPYSITGELLRVITEEMGFVQMASLVLQEEVTARICAEPGSKEYGALTLLVQAWWEVRKGMMITKRAFFPQPAVNSRHLILLRRNPPLLLAGCERLLRLLVGEMFKYRRKRLSNVFSLAAATLGFSKADLVEAATRANIDLRLRPEALSLGDFVKLAQFLQRGEA